MNTLRDVLHNEFSRSWYEAVAIVQELASMLVPGQAVPAPDHLIITANGTLRIDSVDDTSDSPVPGLAGLLQDLLQGTPAPAQLQEFAAENASAKPLHTSVESFARALAFFERPGRTSDLQAVARRLASFSPQQPQPEQEFEQLRHKLAAAPEKPSSRRFSLSKPQRRTVIAAGIVVLIGSVGAVALNSRSGAGRSVRSVITGAYGRAEDKIAKVLSLAPAQPENATAEAPAQPAVGTASSPQPVRSAARDKVKRVSVTPRASAISESERIASALAALEAARPSFAALPVLEPPVIPSGATSSEAAEGDRVYSSADAAVRPPVLMRPQLPSLPPPTPRTSYYEILVDEKGAVEMVKTISPMRRYYDVMLVAAAKAWLFKPATLNGHPVKYWLRVPVTVREGLQ